MGVRYVQPLLEKWDLAPSIYPNFGFVVYPDWLVFAKLIVTLSFWVRQNLRVAVSHNPPSVASCRAWPAQELPPRRYPVTAHCSRSRYSAQDSHNLRLIRTEESIPTSARATVTRLLELAQLPVPSAHRLARRKAICSPDLTRGRRSASTRLDVSCPLLTTFTEKYSRRTSLAVHRIESTTMLGSRSPPSPI